MLALRERGALPKELVLLVQDQAIIKALVTGLKTYYPNIPSRVANYLVAEVMADTKGYFEFHRKLFQHPWETRLEPPTTPSMQRHTTGLKP